MPDDKVINKTISLYPTEQFIIDAVSRMYGFNDSQAIRFIVNQWARTNPGDGNGSDDTGDRAPLLQPTPPKARR